MVFAPNTAYNVFSTVIPHFNSDKILKYLKAAERVIKEALLEPLALALYFFDIKSYKHDDNFRMRPSTTSVQQIEPELSKKGNGGIYPII